MLDLKQAFMRLAITTNDLSMLDQHVGPDYYVYTLPGYTIPQCLRWKMPVIVSNMLGLPVGMPSLVMRYRGGWYYGLVEDANDVAGISQCIADRAKA